MCVPRGERHARRKLAGGGRAWFARSGMRKANARGEGAIRVALARAERGTCVANARRGRRGDDARHGGLPRVRPVARTQRAASALIARATDAQRQSRGGRTCHEQTTSQECPLSLSRSASSPVSSYCARAARRRRKARRGSVASGEREGRGGRCGELCGREERGSFARLSSLERCWRAPEGQRAGPAVLGAARE